MSMRDKLHTGELYLPGDEEIMAEQTKCPDRLYDFNMTRPSTPIGADTMCISAKTVGSVQAS